GGEPVAQRRHDPTTRQQERPPVGMDMRRPEGRGTGHRHAPRASPKACGKDWRTATISVCCAPRFRAVAALAIEDHSVKVIASSLRKGNIVEHEGQLYVVLNAESFHPGKGTPTTQVDMRRISDGVKTAQRYKTTEQVERAHVEEREHTFLYHDGEGFHFMNTENYDQITLQDDVIGDQSAYLQPEMKVQFQMHEGNAISTELPQKVILEVTETEPATKGQTAASSYKPAILANGVRTAVPPFIGIGTRIVVMTADGSYVER